MGQTVGACGLPPGVARAPGKPTPRGCTESVSGTVNFQLDAPGSRSAWLVLILPEHHPALAHLGLAHGGELAVMLDPSQNRTGDSWHIQLTVTFPTKGVRYMWMLDPPIGGDGRPLASAKRLLDPCARALDSASASGWNRREGPRYSPQAVVPDHRVFSSFDWQGVSPPGLHLKDLVIYEAHVRGFTRNPDSKLIDQTARGGTFLGFVEKIPHLLRLGINCVELLPVFEFDETACPRRNPHNGEQLCNYWGYSTVNFFTPMQRFAARPEVSAAVYGFKTLVRELHRQGIEVILDVVFNHTAEGTWGENNWHCWAAIAKSRYYILSNGKDTNYTGCGNTVNANDPLCADWICECLRFWVEEMHVDGFRFDLASALTRGADGKVQHEPLLMKRIAQDPALERAKMIAEPWDCSWPDGYLVGRFPSAGPPRWAEWNGIFRDTVRRFIKGDAGMKCDFATRICGSSDLFQHNGRAPFHSINFVTAHDGFTLRDLVSYNMKHNECNGENSGDDHNNSWNCGHEGETGDGGVRHMREKQMRNFLVALFLSAGTPMLVYGDEYGRSQRGCNNGWCQDALSWFSWTNCGREDGNLFRFCRLIISLRKAYSHILCRETFMSGKDIWWRHNWDDPYNYLCFILHDHQKDKGYSGLLVAYNAGGEVRSCDLPADKKWYRIIDTNLPSPKDFCENEQSATEIRGDYMMQPYSCIVLKTFSSGGSALDYSNSDQQYARQQMAEQHVQEVIKRRMSMDLNAGLGDGLTRQVSEDEVMSRMRRNASRSGCIISFPGPDGEMTFAMERPAEDHSFKPPPRAEPAPPPPPAPPAAPVEAAPERPAGLGVGTQALSAPLGGGREVSVFLHSSEQDETAPVFVEVVVEGFGSQPLILHWGAIETFGGAWKVPPADVLAASVPESKAVPGAVQTRIPPPGPDGGRRVFLQFTEAYAPKSIEFVIHGPPNQWVKHGRSNFSADLPMRSKAFDEAIEKVSTADLGGKDAQKLSATWKVMGFRVSAIASLSEGGCTVRFLADLDSDLMLHYGAGDDNKKWLWAQSVDFRPGQPKSVREVEVSLPPEKMTRHFMFVLKLGQNHWVKDGAQDFCLELPEDPRIAAARAEAEARREAAAAEARRRVDEARANFRAELKKFADARAEREKAADVAFQPIELSDDAGELDVCCAKVDGGKAFRLEVSACLNPDIAPAESCWLHWGAIMDGRRKEWRCPPEEVLPPNTKLVDSKACQSPLHPTESGVLKLSMLIPGKPSEGADGLVPEIKGVGFVLRVVEGNRWIKGKDGKDCLVMIHQDVRAGGWKGSWADVAAQIVEAECEWSHMTLMHRYNLCKGMIERWDARAGATGEAAMRRLPSWGSLFRAEMQRSTSWSRMPSRSLLDALDAEPAEQTDAEFWSWIFVWQRFSFMRLLDWQRNYNTKPRELASATDGLANQVCAAWKAHPNVRIWCRWTLATLGRGGNRGQDIRDEILHIMHRNKIPETAGHFYEQWHQKLHNNTTPDDVGICKALIAFLRSGGKLDEYWRVLRDHGITQERLASYERAITKEPYLHGDTGRLIMEFENYLKILQSVHDALDLQTSVEASQWCLPADLLRKLQDLCGPSRARPAAGGLVRQRSQSLSDLGEGSQSRFRSIADARVGLLQILNNPRTQPDVIRQLLLLDYSLETQQTVLIQGAAETRLPVLCDQMQALVTGLVGHMPLSAELAAVLGDWMRLAPDCAALRFNGNAVESALLLKALCDRLSRCVGEQVDTFQTLMGAKAAYLGAAVGAAKQVLDVFVDEVLRGSALFSVSLVLKRLEPQLRGIAHLPPWQMIAAVDRPIHGELRAVEKMFHMQDMIFETPTILLSGAVNGEEEVPVGVQAVLVRDAASAPDILSHCAVRARNSGVLLACCFDPTITARIEADLVGQWVEVRCKADGTLSIERADRPFADAGMMRKLSRSNIDVAQDHLQSKPGDTKLVNMNLTNDLNCKWVVTPDEMGSTVVGSKSLNLATLAPKLPKEVRTPQAVALPYGCMQKALTHPENAQKWLPKLQACLKRLQPTTDNQEARAIFEEAQAITEHLELPSELAQSLKKAMEVVGDKDGERRLCKLYDEHDAWEATKKVWASLFGLRPWVSLAKAGRSFHDLNMAVLVQELLPAKYAFVLHTKNPFTGDPNEVYGEVVPGRGETLVGNFPGRALSFRARRGEAPVVSAFLSKSTWLRTQECLIFRSDSNGEDLAGFAGAGLFESICAKRDLPCVVKFHRLQIVTDSEYRRRLLERLAEVGRKVEEAFGGEAQDIEGCVDPQDRIFIVQSRPQV